MCKWGLYIKREENTLRTIKPAQGCNGLCLDMLNKAYHYALLAAKWCLKVHKFNQTAFNAAPRPCQCSDARDPGEGSRQTFLRIITQDLHLYCHFNTATLFNRQGPQMLPGPGLIHPSPRTFIPFVIIHSSGRRKRESLFPVSVRHSSGPVSRVLMRSLAATAEHAKEVLTSPGGWLSVGQGFLCVCEDARALVFEGGWGG